jgi:hypothetical protein
MMGTNKLFSKLFSVVREEDLLVRKLAQLA